MWSWCQKRKKTKRPPIRQKTLPGELFGVFLLPTLTAADADSGRMLGTWPNLSGTLLIYRKQ